MAAKQQRFKEHFTIMKRSLYSYCLIKKFKEKGVYNELHQRAWDKRKFTPEMLLIGLTMNWKKVMRLLQDI